MILPNPIPLKKYLTNKNHGCKLYAVSTFVVFGSVMEECQT
jgi:hypothetical protein